ncbi:MAG: hypothetical protein AB7T10_09820 [bacterium]
MNQFSDYFRFKSTNELKNDYYRTLIPFLLEILERKKRCRVGELPEALEKKYKLAISRDVLDAVIKMMAKKKYIEKDGGYIESTHRGRAERAKIRNDSSEEELEAEKYEKKIEKMKNDEIKMLVKHAQSVSSIIVFIVTGVVVIILFIKYPKDYQKLITFVTATAFSLGATKINFGDVFKPRIVRKVNERYAEYYKRVE